MFVGSARSWMPASAAMLGLVVLYAYPVLQPVLLHDDFQILAKATSWQTTWENLWIPHNEHAMPLGRISTWAMLWLAGDQTAWPRATAMQGPLALLLAVGFVYLFVRRELGHPFYGLTAATFFGVSAVYQQAVIWFAASFSVLSLDMLLLGLLAAQKWRQTGQTRQLAFCAAWCALAPGWFASGYLAGPFCSAYLALSGAGAGAPDDRSIRRARALLTAIAPLLGTALFFAAGIPGTSERVWHAEHYQGKTAAEAFSGSIGLLYTVRSLADNLLLGAFGFSLGFLPDGINLPVACELVLLLLLAVGLLWWRVGAQHRLAGLALCLIVLSYFLAYSARSGWPYDNTMNRTHWSRYHLLPHLGLTLLICAGLSVREGRWFVLQPGGTLSHRQAATLTLLALGLLAAQFPRAVLGMYPPSPEQRAKLQRIADVDQLCRQHHIDKETARKALGHLKIPYSYDTEDGWLLLRGSPQPREMTSEEARELLGAAAAHGDAAGVSPASPSAAFGLGLSR
jgi:hypothetical protein